MKDREVLKVIEVFCSEDYLPPKGTSKEDVIYTWVHQQIAGKDGCKNPHQDWKKDLEDFYKALKKAKEL